MSTETSPRDPAERPPLALIAGPTASGKSDLAVGLALALGKQGRRAVVVNADSAQVYSDLAVLSARPSEAEMRGIEHRLFGAWDGSEACSAADWAARARVDIADLHEAGAVPILVGGTGLYIRTLLEGIAPVPGIDRQVRAEVRDLPVAEAHAALVQEDPEAATRLDPADKARVLRALEVVRATGRTLRAWQEAKEGGIGDVVALHPAILLPPRDWLYARCDARFAAMLRCGAIEEVKALLARGIASDLPVMRAIGVPQLAGFLAGDYGLAEAERQASQATRNYAKRQFTWLRHQPPAEWPRIESETFNCNDIFASLLQH